MLKPLRFGIFEIQEMKLPVRLINTTNEQRLVQGHETTPLRVVGIGMDGKGLLQADAARASQTGFQCDLEQRSPKRWSTDH
ncbi:hypothetical protein TNCV_2672591 [Trichonephila clavipes]|nr:hypothetical protein TNCV_2672591 [Trichonephila clavipes]